MPRVVAIAKPCVIGVIMLLSASCSFAQSEVPTANAAGNDIEFDEAQISEGSDDESGTGESDGQLLFNREAYELEALGPERARLDPVDPNENRQDLIQFVVNGNATFAYGAVGALLIDDPVNSIFIECSGTMIGCQTFLTAEHCVSAFRDGSYEESDFHVYLQSEGIISVDHISKVLPYDEHSNVDIAVLTLSEPARALRPILLNTTDSGTDTSGGDIVGYGLTGTKMKDSGIKRYGRIETADCKKEEDAEDKICWNFDGVSQVYNTCHIDSGGPLLFEGTDGVARLGGVTSDGPQDCGLAEDEAEIQSKDVNVAVYVSWIEEQGGSDVGRLDCGAPTSKLSSNQSFSLGERILEPADSEVHTYTIPTGTTEIQVALNGQHERRINFDFTAVVLAEDLASRTPCKTKEKSNFEHCRIDVSPDDLLLQVTVSLKNEDDDTDPRSYQLTVTAL